MSGIKKSQSLIPPLGGQGVCLSSMIQQIKVAAKESVYGRMVVDDAKVKN